ncbi:MAG: PilZ domain-containing protein [Polynucleobacter sp.]|jgi:hypothetical protein|nr:PilZ domain-containing protein [Polynucleobacter sp.]
MKKGNSTQTGVQRREASRVQSKLPLTMNGKKGITQDISATGLFFEFDTHHEPGSKINFVLELDSPGGKIEMQCSAEVIRVQKLDGKVGIAAKILSQEIKSLGGSGTNQSVV